MTSLRDLGRLLFAIAMGAAGVQSLMFARLGAGTGPPWTPMGAFAAWLTGIVLLAAAACFALGKMMRPAGLLLAFIILLRIVAAQLPPLLADVYKPGPWTSAFELLAMFGAALVIAGAPWAQQGTPGRSMFAEVGRGLFAISLPVFGVQHFLYAHFVATLIPDWIPARLFWAYFVGIAFFAAALSILTRTLAALSAALLGTMFFLWVVLLHAPRVAAASHNANEWTSMWVALAMSGAAFLIAGSTDHGPHLTVVEADGF
jgi:uncharacterized membrane protein